MTEQPGDAERAPEPPRSPSADLGPGVATDVPPGHRRRGPFAIAGVIAVGIAIVAAALATTSSPATPDGPPYGILRPTDGGTEITIPAL